MSAEVMDPQERGDRIMCEIDALTKLDTSTFPLPGFTTKDREPNYQMGSNRFSRAGMALYEYQKHRGLLESQKKKQSERTGESRTDNSNTDGSKRRVNHATVA
ncbi:hypothetical protein AAVH_16474 [Aphelenchoides avenae]|nr:hypothetical protein AAVH_16474 [Aphelenchus avenae]